VFFIRSLGAIQQISLTAKSYERNAVEDIDLPHVQELFEKGADGNGYSFATTYSLTITVFLGPLCATTKSRQNHRQHNKFHKDAHMATADHQIGAIG